MNYARLPDDPCMNMAYCRDECEVTIATRYFGGIKLGEPDRIC